MMKHSQEFANAAKEIGVSVNEIDLQSAISLRDEIIDIYCNKKYEYPLWDNLAKWVGVVFPYAWLWFNKLLLDKEVILFFEPTEYDLAFKIKNGAELSDILENAYKFSFYITNEKRSFLLCYNDHNNLIASGEASEWLINYTVENHKDVDVHCESGLI
jgi:hypothetical protein